MDNLTQQNPQQQIPQPDWDLLVRFLPSGWEEQAKKLGAFTRARKITSPETLLRLVLMHAGVGLSFQRSAEVVECVEGVSMSKVSIWERMRKCGAWLSWILAQMLTCRAQPVPIAGYQARAVDAGTVVGPKGRVQLRLHYSIDLADLRCGDLVISDNHKAEGFQHFRVAAGDLLVADRIYAKAKGIAHVTGSGGHVIVRLGCTSLTLYDGTGAKIDRLSWLRGLPAAEPGERFAQFRDQHRKWVTGRICAIRLSQAHAEKARERLRKQARRTGREVRETTIEHAGYLCLFTTTDKDSLSPELVLELYRARWQVELAFKRLKSLLGAGQLRDMTTASALLWLQGKMLYALLLHAYVDEGGAFSPWGYPLQPRRSSGDRRALARCILHSRLGPDRSDTAGRGAGDPRLATDSRGGLDCAQCGPGRRPLSTGARAPAGDPMGGRGGVRSPLT